jgi:hypothetical protein
LKVEFFGFSFDRPIDTPLALIARPVAAFQSRGPPIS